MASKRKRLRLCANGCGVPPDWPSLVICKPCQDAITAGLEAMLREMQEHPKKTFQEVVRDAKA